MLTQEQKLKIAEVLKANPTMRPSEILAKLTPRIRDAANVQAVTAIRKNLDSYTDLKLTVDTPKKPGKSSVKTEVSNPPETLMLRNSLSRMGKEYPVSDLVKIGDKIYSRAEMLEKICQLTGDLKSETGITEIPLESMTPEALGL
jgi:hypothetical protein